MRSYTVACLTEGTKIAWGRWVAEVGCDSREHEGDEESKLVDGQRTVVVFHHPLICLGDVGITLAEGGVLDRKVAREGLFVHDGGQFTDGEGIDAPR